MSYIYTYLVTMPDEEQYVIAVPNAYICDMLQYRLYDDIKTALYEVTQRDLEILFEVKRY